MEPSRSADPSEKRRNFHFQPQHDAVIRSHVLKSQDGQSKNDAFRNAAIELAAELDGVSYIDVANRWYSEKNRSKHKKEQAEVKELETAGADDGTTAQAVCGSLSLSRDLIKKCIFSVILGRWRQLFNCFAPKGRAGKGDLGKRRSLGDRPEPRAPPCILVCDSIR